MKVSYWRCHLQLSWSSSDINEILGVFLYEVEEFSHSFDEVLTVFVIFFICEVYFHSLYYIQKPPINSILVHIYRKLGTLNRYQNPIEMHINYLNLEINFPLLILIYFFVEVEWDPSSWNLFCIHVNISLILVSCFCNDINEDIVINQS